MKKTALLLLASIILYVLGTKVYNEDYYRGYGNCWFCEKLPFDLSALANYSQFNSSGFALANREGFTILDPTLPIDINSGDSLFTLNYKKVTSYGFNSEKVLLVVMDSNNSPVLLQMTSSLNNNIFKYDLLDYNSLSLHTKNLRWVELEKATRFYTIVHIVLLSILVLMGIYFVFCLIKCLGHLSE